MRLFFLCAVCLVAALCTFADVYVETLFTVEWGGEDSAFRKQRNGSSDAFGPVTFFVSGKEEFYFPDRLHKCIRVYNRKGKQQRTLPFDRIPTHFTADKTGRVYARSHGGVISAYCSEKTSDKAFHHLNLPYSRDFVEGYGREIFIQKEHETGESTVYIYTLSGKAYPVFTVCKEGDIRKSEKNIRRGIAGSDGLYYQTRWTAPDRGIVIVFDQTDTPVQIINVHLEEGRLGTFLFKGVDKKGNILVELEKIIDGYAYLEVRQIDRNGSLLQSVEFPNNYRTAVYQKTFLHENVVYQMLTVRNGLQINYWKVHP